MSKLRIRLKYKSKEEWTFCDLKQIKTILDLSARIKERFSVEEIFLSLDGYYNLYKKVRSWLLAEIHLIVYPIGELLEEKALAVLDGDFYFMDLMTTLPRTNLLCMKNAGTQWIIDFS